MFKKQRNKRENQKTPAHMELPLTTLNATMKFSSPRFDNEIGKLVFSEAFAAFMGDPNQDFNAQSEELERAGVDHIFVVKDSPTRRRFAGDITLSRGCYFSICNDDLGNDHGTVVREILAYYSPETGGDLVLHNLVMPENRELLQKYCPNAPAGYVIELRSTPHRTNPIVLKLRSSGLMPSDSDIPPSVHIFMPQMIKQETIEGVFDLRQLETQRWLTAFLPQGDEVLSKMADDLDAFPAMLPSLTTWQLGGTDFTDALGNYLRLKGASGLVFPSARCDVICEFLQGKLDNFKGWNFVDYRNVPPPLADAYTDMSPWEDRIGDGIKIVSAPDDHPYANSWKIEGKEAWEDSIRERRLKEFYEQQEA